jgi:aryl-alcohol dehydrogenase-like predicted oxidoreductase
MQRVKLGRTGLTVSAVGLGWTGAIRLPSSHRGATSNRWSKQRTGSAATSPVPT